MHAKTLGSMTADEIANYRGTIHGARCTMRRPGRDSYPNDFEETSEEAVNAKIDSARAAGFIVDVHQRYTYER